MYQYTAPAGALTGSVEDFIAIKFAKGVTSGHYNMPWIQTLTNVIYNGVSVPQSSGIAAPGMGNKFSWDAQGNITCGA
jgi:hypothetical protein